MICYSLMLLLFLHSGIFQTTDKYSDEDRPYKFGFNIQGYQHRQEEKDEKGLIKGEYGFITADGYYRVTVYATDENGDFRIISMKNYYVGFPPEDPTTTPEPPSRRGNSRGPLTNPTFNPQPGPVQLQRAPEEPHRNARPFKNTPRPSGLPACSDCSIPTTTQRPNPPSNFQSGFGGAGNKGGSLGGSGNQGGGFGGAGNQGGSFGKAENQGGGGGGDGFGGGSFGQSPTAGRFPGQGSPQKGKPGFPSRGQGPGFPQSGGSGGFGGSGGSGPGGSAFGNQQSGPGFTSGGGDFGSSKPGFPGGQGFVQNNQLGESPRPRPQIGQVQDGLPPGVSISDIKDLLYRFNYTVGFHGHHEDGYRNGDKEGDYFFDGRDGVERKVEYIANEFGYQPNITLIELPENDVRRPKEQTEKEYGLKGYEFKWFYRR